MEAVGEKKKGTNKIGGKETHDKQKSKRAKKKRVY